MTVKPLPDGRGAGPKFPVLALPSILKTIPWWLRRVPFWVCHASSPLGAEAWGHWCPRDTAALGTWCPGVVACWQPRSGMALQPLSKCKRNRKQQPPKIPPPPDPKQLNVSRYYIKIHFSKYSKSSYEIHSRLFSFSYKKACAQSRR